MPRLSIGLSVLVIVAATVAVGLGEFWLRPTASYLLTPLIVSALALVFAFRAYLRDAATQKRHERELQQSAALRLATVEALALAIDARHRSSQSPLRREQQHAAALARAFGMSDEEIEGVRTASLLHDVGKLAVPDHILTKSGPLSEDERGKMRTHASVGAGIIANVPFPYPVATIMRSHHERWDGTGYPEGLRGTGIPLGARILAAVDCFTAVTSDRPLNVARPIDEAIRLLSQEAGHALDPAVVTRYVAMLPALQEAGVEDDRAAAAVATLDQARRAGSAAAGPRESSAVLDDIGGANQELYGLYEVAQAMGTGLGVADSMSVIASKLSNLVPFDTCALFLYDAPNGVARCRFAAGEGQKAFSGLLIRDGEGLVGRAIASRECVMNGDPAADFEPARTDLAEAGLRSALVCPLIDGSALLGALALYHTTPRYFTDDHRRLVVRVSSQVATVINNAAVFERTWEESVTDPLTGLPNTRFLLSNAGRELARAARLNTFVTVLIVDMDGLKPINDSYGHTTGNRALCAVAAVLRSAIRPYDICVRFGGDEFIVLLSDCGADQAEPKRLELQKAVEAMPFTVDELTRVKLSVSVGAAVFPVDGDTYDALLQVADSRMYQDKAGRKQRQTRRTPEPV